MRPLLHGSAMEYWRESEENVMVPSKCREGYVTQNMWTYWQKVMNAFVDFVANQEHERVVIGPPRSDVPPNRRLIPNTPAISAWAARLKISFVGWHANLDGWVIHGENVPEEWRKRNKIVEVPKPETDENKTPSKRA